jgi:hypothetical protein
VAVSREEGRAVQEGQHTVNRLLDPDLGKTVLGIIRYLQVCHSVLDFAPFPGPEWDEFMHSAEKLVENKLHRSLGVGFIESPRGPAIDRRGRERISAEFEFTTSTDRLSRRFHLDVTGDVWGMEFGARFPHLAKNFFDVALCVPDFIRFG